MKKRINSTLPKATAAQMLASYSDAQLLIVLQMTEKPATRAAINTELARRGIV